MSYRVKVIGISLLASVLLTGCIPVVVAGGAAAAATKVAGDNRTVQTISDDADLAYRANSRLRSNAEVNKKAHITAAAYNHVLLLVGQAPTPELRALAENDVQNLAGIRRIYNEITIQQPIGSFDRSNDMMITTNIKARMLATSDLHASQFDVITENGTVYLLGLSTRSQANTAAELISKRYRVTKVVKLVEYRD